MMPLEESLRDVTSFLADRGAAFALVGGLALAVRAEPRFTKDVDLAVSLSDDRAAEALKRFLDHEECALARAALGLITARGYHRGVDLEARLAEVLADG